MQIEQESVSSDRASETVTKLWQSSGNIKIAKSEIPPKVFLSRAMLGQHSQQLAAFPQVTASHSTCLRA